MGQKIVLFDFDGVIVNTFEMCLKLGQRQYPDLTPETYRDFSNGNIYESIAAREKVSPKVDHFDYFIEYPPLLMKEPPINGIKQVLHELAGKYPLVIVSSTIDSPIQDYLSMHNMASYFAEVLGKNHDTSKTRKIEGVLQRYHLSPADAIFITDSLGDMKEATAAGVRSIGVTWGFHQKERLLRGNPCAIADDPAHLADMIERAFSN